MNMLDVTRLTQPTPPGGQQSPKRGLERGAETRGFARAVAEEERNSAPTDTPTGAMSGGTDGTGDPGGQPPETPRSGTVRGDSTKSPDGVGDIAAAVASAEDTPSAATNSSTYSPVEMNDLALVGVSVRPNQTQDDAALRDVGSSATLSDPTIRSAKDGVDAQGRAGVAQEFAVGKGVPAASNAAPFSTVSAEASPVDVVGPPGGSTSVAVPGAAAGTGNPAASVSVQVQATGDPTNGIWSGDTRDPEGREPKVATETRFSVTRASTTGTDQLARPGQTAAGPVGQQAPNSDASKLGDTTRSPAASDISATVRSTFFGAGTAENAVMQQDPRSTARPVGQRSASADARSPLSAAQPDLPDAARVDGHVMTPAGKGVELSPAPAVLGQQLRSHRAHDGTPRTGEHAALSGAASASQTTTGIQTVATTPAPVAERAVVQQIVNSVPQGTVPGRIEVQLDPPELGRVEIAIEVNDQSLRATLSAERQMTGDLIRRHLDMLHAQFREAGFTDVDLSYSGQREGRSERQENADHIDAPFITETARQAPPSAKTVPHQFANRIDVRL